MALDLTKIVELQGSGTSDMGSLTFGRTVGAGAGAVDDNDKARFWIPRTLYALVAVRVHFAFGSGAAPFTINIDHGLGEAYDLAIMTLTPDVGTGVDVNFRVAENEMQHWMFDGRRGGGDKLVGTWANPDDGVMEWGATWSLYPIDEVAPL